MTVDDMSPDNPHPAPTDATCNERAIGVQSGNGSVEVERVLAMLRTGKQKDIEETQQALERLRERIDYLLDEITSGGTGFGWLSLDTLAVEAERHLARVSAADHAYSLASIAYSITYRPTADGESVTI